MGNVRGLRTRLCPRCGETTPHRTLYAKIESGGRTRWFQLFWACTKCGSLNHVLLPSYRLESASSRPPSTLAIGVVHALEARPLDFEELVGSLRRGKITGARHVFNSEVLMALEYLKGRGVIAEEASDRTERTIDALRVRLSESRHLGTCPEETKHHVVRRSLISLYSQGRTSVELPGQCHVIRGKRLRSVGVLCLHCLYHELEPEALRQRPSDQL